MSLFKKKKKEIPHISLEREEPVIRSSICTGEQVLCVKNRETGHLSELMLIRTASDLSDFCEENGISMEDIRKIY